MKTRKATLDDGCNPELVRGADFDGYLGIPIIHKPEKMIIPSGMTPFTYRNRITSGGEAICFHEKDPEFSDVLIRPDDYLDVFQKHILISPDCSLYRDAPLAVQITNVYRNRAWKLLPAKRSIRHPADPLGKLINLYNQGSS